MKYPTLLLLFFCAPAFAGKITYRKDSDEFTLEHDGKTLSYSSPTVKHVFIIDSCNREMVEKFWQRTLRNAERFQPAKGLPDGKKGYVQIDKEYRHITPAERNRLSKTEYEMIRLRVREKEKCKR